MHEPSRPEAVWTPNFCKRLAKRLPVMGVVCICFPFWRKRSYFGAKACTSGSGVWLYFLMTRSHDACKISSIQLMLDVGSCVSGSKSMTKSG